MMRMPWILALAAVLATVAGCRSPDAEIQPATVSALAELPPVVADAFRRLDRELPSETRDSLRAAPPGGMWRYHHSIGMYVRNEYGLWQGGPLQDYFRAKGLRHPDDMSGVLLEGYGLYLRGARVKVDSLIQASPPPPPELEASPSP
jgi:hypothetical protein